MFAVLVQGEDGLHWACNAETVEEAMIVAATYRNHEEFAIVVKCEGFMNFVAPDLRAV
jgi:hypothetical protein